jgi:predicted dehydrogenase
MIRLSRRRFLEDALLAAAAVPLTGSMGQSALSQEKSSTSANEKLGIAVIGVRGRGGDHIRVFSARSDCEVRIVCDADRDVGMRVAQRTGSHCRFVQDMRQAFDDKSIDIVSIATPNHWHALAAIWAMQAGKDVYVEKPVSHNVSEGRRMVQVARKLKRICQAGTQHRSDSAKAAAVRYLAAGKLGKITLARSVTNRRRSSIGPVCQGTIPPGVDYNLWAGPAPMAPVTRKNFHYDWHWIWDFGNGEIGNNDVHMVDLVRWGLGVTTLPQAVMCYGGRFLFNDAGQTANTQVVIHDYGEVTVVEEIRNLDTKSGFAPSGGMFNGTEGYLVLGSRSATVFDPSGKKVQTFKGETEDHFANFLKGVRSRKLEDLNAEIFGGHLSAGLCHLGNISYRLGRAASAEEITRQLQARKVHDNVVDTFERTVKHLATNGVDIEKDRLTLGPWLQFNPEKEVFLNHPEADRLLTRPYRSPFVVPRESEI